MKDKLIIATLTSLLFGLLSCTGPEIKQSEISKNANLGDAFEQTTRLDMKARAEHADFYARENYLKGEEKLKSAQKSISGEDLTSSQMEETINSLKAANTFFKSAINKAVKIKLKYPEVSKARQAALDKFSKSAKEFDSRLDQIDREILDESNSFNESLDADEVAAFQSQYLELEVYAVQRRELGEAHDRLIMLKEKNANKYLPKTFNATKTDILAAENLIARSPRNSINYYASVNEARKSLKFLSEVYTILENNGFETPERSAVQLVNQQRALGEASQSISNLSNKVISQESKIHAQETLLALQEKLNRNEAEVFLRGNQVVVRVKDLKFGVGSSTLPTNSKQTLNRVKGVIGEIEPKTIVVQGHTDSTGSSAINRQIGKQRANEVARFLKGNGVISTFQVRGLGEELPIASNSTAKGRKQNRRVELVIPITDTSLYSE